MFSFPLQNSSYYSYYGYTVIMNIVIVAFRIHTVLQESALSGRSKEIKNDVMLENTLLLIKDFINP